MLGYIFNKTAAVVSSTYDLVSDATEYVRDDIASIPEAISTGWDNPILSSSATPEDTVEVVEPTPTKFGAK